MLLCSKIVYVLLMLWCAVVALFPHVTSTSAELSHSHRTASSTVPQETVNQSVQAKGLHEIPPSNSTSDGVGTASAKHSGMSYRNAVLSRTSVMTLVAVKEQNTMDSRYDESLASLLVWLMYNALPQCSLLLAVDPSYLSSPLMIRLTSLPHPKQVVVLREPRDLLGALWNGELCRAYLFLLNNTEPILSFADHNPRVWDYYGKYIFVGLSPEQLETLTRTKKGRKTQHLVGLVKTDLYSQSESVGWWRVYVNQLYSKHNLTFLATWRRSQFTLPPVIFPDKISDLRGATLNVATFEFPPAVLYDHKGGDGRAPRLYGRDVEVVRALAAAGNFSLNFREVPHGEVWGTILPNGSWNGIIGMLGSGTADLAVANIFITSLLGRRDHQHFSAPFHQSVNCVILKVPPPVPRWQAPFWPFRKDTWLALAVGVLLISPILYCLARYSARSLSRSSYLESIASSYLYVIALHLSEPPFRIPSTHTGRMIVSFLWLYAMVIGAFYRTNLTAFLTVTRQPKTIDTYKDFYDSGQTIVGLGPIFGNLMKHSVNIYLKELYKRFKPIPHEPESWVLDGRAGYITSFHNSEYLVAHLNSGHRSPIVKVMKECTWPFSVGVAIQSNSPLKPKVDLVVYKIVESGLVSHWFEESVRIATQERKMQLRDRAKNKETAEETTQEAAAGSDLEAVRVVPLTVDHVQGIFYILFPCFLASLLVFLAELAIDQKGESKAEFEK